MLKSTIAVTIDMTGSVLQEMIPEKSIKIMLSLQKSHEIASEVNSVQKSPRV